MHQLLINSGLRDYDGNTCLYKRHKIIQILLYHTCTRYNWCRRLFSHLTHIWCTYFKLCCFFSYALNPTNQYLLRIWKTLQPYVVYTAPTIALIFYIENRDTNIHRHLCLKTSIFDGFNLSNSQIKWYCFNSMNTLWKCAVFGH